MDNPPDDGPCEVTITAPDHDWLMSFVHKLLDGRLIAAAHLDAMNTVYRWAGSVEQNVEARAVIHSCLRAVPLIEARLHADHPFEVPCLAVTRFVTGSEAYLNWIDRQVTP